MEQSEKTLDMIVNLCKNRGYVFPGSEIYTLSLHDALPILRTILIYDTSSLR